MSEHRVELVAAWQGHVGFDTDLLDRLIARHREKHRRYHGVEHVTWVVRHVLELAQSEPVDDLDAIVAAAFYHDAIYEPASPANERASARLARRDLAELGWTDDRTARVAAMIEETAGHTDPADEDAAVLFDADLAVLGADPAGYGDYVRGVREEYSHVDDDGWRRGRAVIVRGFLERPAIFATATAIERWEHRARANLTAELATLNSSG